MQPTLASQTLGQCPTLQPNTSYLLTFLILSCSMATLTRLCLEQWPPLGRPLGATLWKGVSFVHLKQQPAAVVRDITSGLLHAWETRSSLASSRPSWPPVRSAMPFRSWKAALLSSSGLVQPKITAAIGSSVIKQQQRTSWTCATQLCSRGWVVLKCMV